MRRCSFITAILFLTIATSDSLALEPKLVTLQAKEISLKQAIETIAKQTEIKVEIASGFESKPLTVNLEKKTFWQALDAIANQVNGVIYPFGSNGAILLKPRLKGKSSFVSHAGIFRAQVTRITSSRNFETDGHELTLKLEVAWEPTLVPFYLQKQPLKLTCFDEAGNPLATLNAGASWLDVNNQNAAQFTISLNRLPIKKGQKQPTKIGSLKGRLLLRAAPKMVKFDFGRLSRLLKSEFPIKKGIEGATCEIRAMKLAGGNGSVRIHATLPKTGPTLESYQFWFEQNRLTLKSDKHTFTPVGDGNRQFSSRSLTTTYLFDDLDEVDFADLTLIYEMPSSLVELPIDISFNNMPLP